MKGSFIFDLREKRGAGYTFYSMLKTTRNVVSSNPIYLCARVSTRYNVLL
jgi:hypothetical protein